MIKEQRGIDPHQALMTLRRLAARNLANARDVLGVRRKLRTELLFEREFARLDGCAQAAVMARIKQVEAEIAEAIYGDLNAAINHYAESVGVRDHLRLVVDDGKKSVPDQAAT